MAKRRVRLNTGTASASSRPSPWAQSVDRPDGGTHGAVEADSAAAVDAVLVHGGTAVRHVGVVATRPGVAVALALDAGLAVGPGLLLEPRPAPLARRPLRVMLALARRALQQGVKSTSQLGLPQALSPHAPASASVPPGRQAAQPARCALGCLPSRRTLAATSLARLTPPLAGLVHLLAWPLHAHCAPMDRSLME